MVIMGDNCSTPNNIKGKPYLSFSISRILDLNLDNISSDTCNENCTEISKPKDRDQTHSFNTNAVPTIYSKFAAEDLNFSDHRTQQIQFPYTFWIQDRNSSRRLGHPYQSRAPPKRKKQRASFSRGQIKELEKLFSKKKYLSSSERQQIAKNLDMTDCQVKTWYQNRRTKWKRENEEEKQEERQAMAKALLTTPRDWWPSKGVFRC